jgi:hypothetical protein
MLSDIFKVDDKIEFIFARVLSNITNKKNKKKA